MTLGLVPCQEASETSRPRKPPIFMVVQIFPYHAGSWWESDGICSWEIREISLGYCMNRCREPWPGHPLEERTTWGIFQPPMVKDYYGSKGFEPFLIFFVNCILWEREKGRVPATTTNQRAHEPSVIGGSGLGRLVAFLSAPILRLASKPKIVSHHFWHQPILDLPHRRIRYLRANTIWQHLIIRKTV